MIADRTVSLLRRAFVVPCRRLAVTALLLSGAATLCGQTATTPAVGAQAPAVSLSPETGKPVSLSAVEHDGKVVLVILRGYPGYQCPYCTRQVHDFVEHADAFSVRHTSVLLVYPGPPADLDAHAKEFLEKQAKLPGNIRLVTDPDYKVTNQYGLRWDAPHETAYPLTFVLDATGKVLFEKVSHGHGDRTSASDVLAQLGH